MSWARKKIYTSAGATDLTTVNSRLTVLENNTYEITYFEEFSATTGQVTVPTGGTIALNQFAGGVDAYVSTVSSSQPTGVFPVTAGGVTVDVSSFDASGNFTLSGTPSAYPIAIIYVFRITGLNLSNINNDKVINLKDTNFQPLDSDLTAIAALSPTNDDIIQRKSGAWTNRTMTQLGADLAIKNTALNFYGAAFSPADSTTYYFCIPGEPAATGAAAASRGISCPISGTVKSVGISFFQASGSAETSELKLHNDTTASNDTISAAITHNASTRTYLITGLSITVTAGDVLSMQWITPAWATNPTSCRPIITIFIE